MEKQIKTKVEAQLALNKMPEDLIATQFGI